MKTPTKRAARRLAASLAIITALATSGAWAEDRIVSEDFTLTEDMTVDALTIESGVTLDLNGYKLTCSSLDGSGTITSTESDLTAPGGTCTKVSPSQSYQSTVAANLFNDNFTYVTDAGHRLVLRTSQTNQKLPLRVDYDFGDGNAKVVDKYTIYTGANSRAPKAWKLYGSDFAYGTADESGWTLIDERTSEMGWTNTSSGNTAYSRTYTCANDTAYRYYRLLVTAHNGDEYFEMVQLEYFKSGELHLNVASGSAAWPSSITFTGNIKVVKEGEGELACSDILDMNDGMFVIAAGTVRSSGNFRLATVSGKTVNVEVAEGGTLYSGSVLAIGCNGTATLMVNGGTVYSADTLRVGNSSSGSGTLTINSGTVQVASGNTLMYQQGTGTVNLNGGMLKTPRIAKGYGSGTLNFNGGTLQAQSGNPSSPYFVAGTLSAVNVLAGGGTIDANGNVAQIGMPLVGEGAMTFKGGSTITLAAANTYMGGTTIELGTTVNASDATAKATVLNNLVIDGRAVLEGKTYDVLVTSGLDPATALDNVQTPVNCSAAATVGFDNGETPTKIVVTLATPTGVNTTTPIMAFPGKTLNDIKYADFTSRMFGKYANDYNALDSATGCNKKFYYNGDDLTSIVVEFQASDGANIRCVVVEFTDDGNDVYATALGARYQPNASLGFLFLEQDKTTWHGAYKAVTTSRTGGDYGVCDFRYTVGAQSVTEWTLDADTTWSALRNGATLAGDEIVQIRVTDADAVLTVDEDVDIAQLNFVDGADVTFTINEGVTVSAGSYSGLGYVLNQGIFQKWGDGTVEMKFDNASRGAFVVNAGTLKATGKKTPIVDAGTPIVGDPDVAPRSNFLIDVKSGATYDVNGQTSVSASVRLAEGARFINGGSNANTGWGQTGQLILAGDAYVTANGNFGLNKSGGSRLDLGSHTLTVNSANDTEFMLSGTTIAGAGTIYVASGRLCTRNGDSTGEDCTISIGAGGKFENNMHFTVKNFVNNGTILTGSSWGRGELEVTGEFTSKTATFPKLTLTGATVKAATGAVVTVSDAFNTSGTITLDASEITKAQLEEAEDERIPVLSVPTANKGGIWTVSGLAARVKWVDNGDDTSTLYLCKPVGLMVIIR